MTETNQAETVASPTGEIVAPGDNWYRGKMLIMSLVIIGYCGIFFLYDGFVGYPRHNAKIAELRQQEKDAELQGNSERRAALEAERIKIGKEHTDFDITLQKIIGFVMTPLGVYMLIRTMRKSRGSVRLKDQTVYVPGHPPVPFEAITAIDNRRWEKKGIAHVDYSLSEGRNGQFVLDDFAYLREPLDKIHDAIVTYLNPEDEASKEASTTESQA